MKKLICFALLAGTLYGADTIIKYDEDADTLTGKFPVGEATQTALDLKADLDGSNFADYPQTITVSGSDESKWNGDYSYSNDMSSFDYPLTPDKNYYWVDGNEYIFYQLGQWKIKSTDGGVGYQLISTSDVPPKTGWSDGISLSYTLLAEDFRNAIYAAAADGSNLATNFAENAGLVTQDSLVNLTNYAYGVIGLATGSTVTATATLADTWYQMQGATLQVSENMTVTDSNVTCQVAGWYSLDFAVGISDNTQPGAQVDLRITTNGTEVAGTYLPRDVSENTKGVTAAAALIYLESNDVVAVEFRSDGAGDEITFTGGALVVAKHGGGVVELDQTIVDDASSIPSGAAVYNQTKGFDYIYTDIGSLTGLAYTYNPVLYGLWKEYDVLADGQILDNKMVDFSINQEDLTIESPALVFDGVGDYVEANQIELTGSTNLDISTWIKVDNPTDGFIVSSYGSDRSFILRYISGGTIRLTVSGDGTLDTTYTLETTETINDNEWHFLHAYKHGTEMGISIDGGTAITTNVTAGLNTGDASLLIGVSSSDTLYFTGQLADMQVSSDFETVRYPFTEDTGTTVYDVTTNGNHGTAVITSSDAEFWGGTQTNSPYAAQYGASKVMSFDGSAYANGANTTLGAGDFYYGFSFICSDLSSSPYVFSDGDAAGGVGKWASFQALNDGELLFGVDDDVTRVNTAITPAGGVAANELIVGSVQRTSGSLWWEIDNITRGTTHTGSVANTTEYYDASNYLTIGGARVNGTRTQPFYGYISLVEYGTNAASVISSYTAANAYPNVLPDNVGTNDTTLVNVGLVNIPALLDGSDDAAGLGITNPGGLAHNNGGYTLSNSVIGEVSFEELTTNTAYTTTTTNDLIKTFYK